MALKVQGPLIYVKNKRLQIIFYSRSQISLGIAIISQLINFIY